jgi:hypothetical protein
MAGNCLVNDCLVRFRLAVDGLVGHGPARSRSVGHGLARFCLVSFCAASFCLGTAGCALMPQFGRPEPVGPPEPGPETTQPDQPEEPEHHVGIVPHPDTWPRVPYPDTSKTATSVKKPAAPRAPAGSASAAGSRPDSLEAAKTPAVTVSLPEAELRKLEARAREDLDETSRLLGSVEAASLDSSEREKRRTVIGFVAQAESALESQDIQAAANLAHKARLLAEELTSQ